MALDLASRVLRSRAVDVLATPHGIDRYLKHINPMWAAHEVRARILDVRREAPGVATVTLQPTSTWQGHRPGQHVSVGVEVDGTRRTTRVFTISSPTSRPGERFTLTIRANEEASPERGVSRFLTSPDAVGRIVHLSQAEGEFTLPAQVPEHIVLISGGSGITPVMAMLRSLQLRTHRGQVTFLHWARGREHQIYAEELERIRHSGHGIDVHLLYPGEGDPYLSPALLERLVPGYRDIPAWACGPAGLMEAVQGAYADRVDEGSLAMEYFKPPRVSGTAGGSLSFERSGVSATNTGGVLLEQAEAAGLTPEFGCRMGICFSCTATKREGTVRNILTGEVSSLPDDEIRICVSAPEGDCAIDL